MSLDTASRPRRALGSMPTADRLVRRGGGATTRARRASRLAFWLFVAAAAVVSLAPFAAMLVTALKPDKEIEASQRWLPVNWTFRHVLDIFTNSELYRMLSNSAIIAGGTVALVLVCAVPAAYVLARSEFAGRRVFLDVVLVTQTVSPVVLIVPLFALFGDLHLLGSYASVILASAAFVMPFSIWLLVAYFRRVSVEIEEAARLDGCSRLRFMFDFLIPNSVPGIAATSVYMFLYGWNEFIFSLTFLSSDPGRWPLTIGVFSNAGQWFTRWQPLMLTAAIGTVPVVILFLALRRHLEEGLGRTAGA